MGLKIKTQGFTLIEILIAMAVFASIVLVLIASSNTFGFTILGRSQAAAVRIAQKQIENLKTTPFSSLPASGPISDPDLQKLENGQGTLTITDWQGNPALKLTEVEITWTQNNATRTINLTTLLTENGI